MFIIQLDNQYLQSRLPKIKTSIKPHEGLMFESADMAQSYCEQHFAKNATYTIFFVEDGGSCEE